MWMYIGFYQVPDYPVSTAGRLDRFSGRMWKRRAVTTKKLRAVGSHHQNVGALFGRNGLEVQLRILMCTHHNLYSRALNAIHKLNFG